MKIPSTKVLCALLIIWAAMLIFNSNVLAVVFLLLTAIAYCIANNNYISKNRKN